MALQNNTNDSWTKPTLQSFNMPRPRTFEPNVNIKHAYYDYSNVTMIMTHCGDIMPANTRFNCIVFWFHPSYVQSILMHDSFLNYAIFGLFFASKWSQYLLSTDFTI